jgi:hypothetical protein
MPLYGKGAKGKFARTTPTQLKDLQVRRGTFGEELNLFDNYPLMKWIRALSKRDSIEAQRNRRIKRVFQRDSHSWPIERTPLRTVMATLRINLVREAEKRAKQKRPVVVDWGCGEGSAITFLAHETKKLKNSPKLYGFSNRAYSTWAENQAVKFIHAPAEDFARYFKDSSIDILYSHQSLHHLPEEYTLSLIPKLSKRGILVTNEFSTRVIEMMAPSAAWNAEGTHARFIQTVNGVKCLINYSMEGKILKVQRIS